VSYDSLPVNGRISMRLSVTLVRLAWVVLAAACSRTSTDPAGRVPAPAGGLSKVNHIIIVMMENHSFDNYFGALAYAPGSPYHAASAGCAQDDHGCVDGLTCKMDPSGSLICTN